MNILGALGSLFGIGKDFLNNRAKLKRLKQEQEHEIIKAETEAIITRIKGNSESDNEIDIITARNKKNTWKDDIIVYLFLIPILVASATPFLVAYENTSWLELNNLVRESYVSLDQLPDWYKYVLAAIIIDTIGMRSFFRKIFNAYVEKRFGNDRGDK